MAHPLPLRLSHAWAVLIGRYTVSPAQIAERLFMTELAKTNAALARLQTAALTLKAANAGASTNAAALADAQATIASIDDSVAEQVDAITAQIAGTDATGDSAVADASAAVAA